MAAIVGIRDGIRDGIEIVPPGEPAPEVIKELERLLEMARAGELTGLAAVLHWRDKCTSGTTVGELTRSMVGTMEIMKAEVIDKFRAEK